ncbi:hypothetical protein E8E13_007263 [Curvularia kusanoi]|uniref:Uncharacterized protein n=1 Tax=Curvularia kusanoi TaxID=90978 RepID=A0A9P4TEA4_CURKU|nr:hypothetical protein E8E13_007263 [Curvularia kusanoi]
MDITSESQLGSHAEEHFPDDDAELPLTETEIQERIMDVEYRVNKLYNIEIAELLADVGKLKRESVEWSDYNYTIDRIILQLGDISEQSAEQIKTSKAAISTLETRTTELQAQAQSDLINDKLASLETRIQQILANNNALKQRADTSKDTFFAFENRMAKLEAEVKTKKGGTGKDEMDWVRECATAKVEVGDLRLKLATSEAQVVMLAKENAELRKKLDG